MNTADSRNPARVSGSDVGHALFWGCLAATLVIAGIYVGSRRLRDFDPALVSYAGAAVFAAFGIGYRYAMWLRRPPTRLYWRRGWQIFLAPRHLGRNLVEFVRLFLDHVVATHAVDPGRVYLTGSSMGGFATWELGLAHPESLHRAAHVAVHAHHTHPALGFVFRSPGERDRGAGEAEGYRSVLREAD